MNKKGYGNILHRAKDLMHRQTLIIIQILNHKFTKGTEIKGGFSKELMLEVRSEESGVPYS